MMKIYWILCISSLIKMCFGSPLPLAPSPRYVKLCDHVGISVFACRKHHKMSLHTAVASLLTFLQAVISRWFARHLNKILTTLKGTTAAAVGQ